ncbi:hypothetical protein MMC13_006072 [Lambiella insularis]|nr:hypothetical protein [Lambiella insularis]
MVSVASLLNPVLAANEGQYQLPSPSSTSYRSDFSPQPNPPYKKQKMSKDAAVFAKGKIQGEVRYPPCEKQDEKIAAEHSKFSVYPIGQISEYRRHIPYNSEKKSFLAKTGRGAFEVFQYTFKMPGDERVYTVMWDYNVGLVRITPFFKCCQYAKTMPAKMLNSNPGLRDICHSITGGALAAQGYWMPFEAAKAVAATFCYQIRYALTPLFGLDFPSLCVKPGEDKFGQMVIDRQIVRRCAEEANGYRASSRESSVIGTPTTPVSATITNTWTPRSLRPRVAGLLESESGYYSDTDVSDKYLASPQSVPPHSSFAWTATNTPRSVMEESKAPSSRTMANSAPLVQGCDAPPNSPGGSSNSSDDTNDDARENDEGSGETVSPRSSKVGMMPEKRPRAAWSTKDTRAAYLLMQLHFADAALRSGSKKRRASS